MPKPRINQLDMHIGLRVREARTIAGLTAIQLSDLLEVSYQQLHKYEKGTNRISAGRLYGIANALGVSIHYFFERMDVDASAVPMPADRSLVLDLLRNVRAIKDPQTRKAVCKLARTLANHADGGSPKEAA